MAVNIYLKQIPSASEMPKSPQADGIETKYGGTLFFLRDATTVYAYHVGGKLDSLQCRQVQAYAKKNPALWQGSVRM